MLVVGTQMPFVVLKSGSVTGVLFGLDTLSEPLLSVQMKLQSVYKNRNKKHMFSWVFVAGGQACQN